MLYRHNAATRTDWNLFFWDNSLYLPFPKTLPRASAFANRILVRFCERAVYKSLLVLCKKKSKEKQLKRMVWIIRIWKYILVGRWPDETGSSYYLARGLRGGTSGLIPFPRSGRSSWDLSGSSGLIPFPRSGRSKGTWDLDNDKGKRKSFFSRQ